MTKATQATYHKKSGLHSRDFPQMSVPAPVDEKILHHIYKGRTQKKRDLQKRRYASRYAIGSMIGCSILILGLFALSPFQSHINDYGNNGNNIDNDTATNAITIVKSTATNTINTAELTDTIDEIDTFVAFLDDDSSWTFDEL